MGTFWRFGFAQEGGIDALLKGWDPTAPPPATITYSSSSTSKDQNGVLASTDATTASTGNETPAGGQRTIEGEPDPATASSTSKPPNTLTLEQLLEEEDILQECKSGDNAKLMEFLSSPYAVRRMLDYVTGEAFGDAPIPSIQDAPPPLPPKDPGTSDSTSSAGSIVIPALDAHTTPDDRDLARKRLKYPYVCTEILSLDSWQITETIFGNTGAYLEPFWNAILDKSPEHLSAVSVQVGHWAKVNILWLSNTRMSQMVAFLKSVPNLLQRILVHLPHISPISDILLKIVNIEDQHPHLRVVDWLREQRLIQQVLDLLDPRHNSPEAHGPAGDFLRGIVAAASAASASKQQQQQQQQQQHQQQTGSTDHQAEGGSVNGDDSAWSNWPNNTLVRELASQQTVEKLLEFMLDARPQKCSSSNDAVPAPEREEEAITPKATSPALTDLKMLKDERMPLAANMTNHSVDSGTPTSKAAETSSIPQTNLENGQLPSAESATSSLLSCLTLLIDIIRKNNSDFTELQILQYLERHADDEESDRDAAQDEVQGKSDDNGGKEGEGEGLRQHRSRVMEEGPSLVDLGPLLRCLTRRLPDLHHLLLHPRSDITPAPSSLQGSPTQEPLTFERFRICELYAELLHCSNMAILNRPTSESSSDPTASSHLFPTYDEETGRVQGTRSQAYERLSVALTPQPSASPATTHSFDDTHEGTANGLEDERLSAVAVDQDVLGIRPVTGQSDVTSSYTSEGTDGGDHGQHSEDVLDFLNSTTEDLSLDEDGLQHPASNSTSDPPSAHTSPMPLETSTMPSLPSSPQLMPSQLPSDVQSSHATGKTSQGTTDVPQLLPGQALKKAFIDLKIIPACLDLFFRFPWNNFLHNVVYDLIQQIFNGKLEEGLNRDLCLAAFTQDGGLINRVLAAVKENGEVVKTKNGVRLGHMGHLTLISEEIVKLFYNNSHDILPLIPEDAFDRKEWETYVEGPLRETRERDLQPLGGGINLAMHGSASTGSGNAGIVDMDDEFPSNQANRFFSAEEGPDGDTSPDKAHFARYLASQISTDLGDSRNHTLDCSSSSGSSDEDSSSDSATDNTRLRKPGSSLHHAAAEWFGSNEGDQAFDDDVEEDDGGAFASSSKALKDAFGVTSTNMLSRKPHVTTAGGERQERFGFEDRFDSLETPSFAEPDSDDDDDDDDGFGPFSDSYAAAPSPDVASSNKGFAFDDDFESSAGPSTSSLTVKRENLTPADWNSSFRTHFESATAFEASFGEFEDFSPAESPGVAPEGDFNDDDDEFGDFATSSDNNNHGDYDFTVSESDNDSTREMPAQGHTESHSADLLQNSGQHGQHPGHAHQPRNNNDSSAVPGRPSPDQHKTSTRSPALSPGEEVIGPGVHHGAHISNDGSKVEAEVEINGETVLVQVPKDELALHPDMMADMPSSQSTASQER